MGVQLAAGPTIGVAGEAATKAFRYGTHVALDIHYLTSYVPIALTAEYAGSYNFEGRGIAYELFFGLYYSGRRDFELGAVFGWTPKTSYELLSGWMVMQYFF